MKEATGELSTTAIAIVAIGLILAIFTAIVLPMIRTQITLNQACNSGPGFRSEKICCDGATGVSCGGSPSGSKVCDGGRAGATGTFTCYYYENGVSTR